MVQKKKKAVVASEKEHARRVAENVDLAGIRLASSLCLNNTEQGRGLPGHAAQHINININLDSEDSLLVIADFGIHMGYEANEEYSESPESPVLIKAAFLLRYALKNDGFTPDDAQSFASITGMYNAWPYWREFVQSMTTRMGFPGLTLPLFHPQSLLEVEEKANKRQSARQSSTTAKKSSKKAKRTSRSK